MQHDRDAAAGVKLVFTVTEAPVKIGDTWHVAGQCMVNLRVGDQFNEMAMVAKVAGSSMWAEEGRRSTDLRIKEIYVRGQAVSEWEAGSNARLILTGDGADLRGPCRLYFAEHLV